jgi:hypothetical protein
MSDNKINANGGQWKKIVILTCGLIICHGIFLSRNSSSNIVYLLAFYTPICIIFWAIIYFSFLRGLGTKIGITTFLLVYISLFVGGGIGYYKNKRNMASGLSEIQDRYNGMVNQPANKAIDRPNDLSPKSFGDIGKMELFMKSFMDQLAKEKNSYLAEMEAAGWNKLFDARRIDNDRSGKEGIEIINSAKMIVLKYSNGSIASLNKARDDIQSIKFNDISSSEALTYFEQGMEKSKEDTEKIWSLELEYVSESYNAIRFLSDYNNSWNIEDGSMAFKDTDKMQKYNDIIIRIQKISTEQDLLRKKMINDVNGKLDPKIQVR